MFVVLFCQSDGMPLLCGIATSALTGFFGRFGSINHLTHDADHKSFLPPDSLSKISTPATYCGSLRFPSQPIALFAMLIYRRSDAPCLGVGSLLISFGIGPAR